MVDTTTQDDLLLVAALARYASEFETAKPQLADRPWRLAVAIAAEHGLDPGDAVRQLE